MLSLLWDNQRNISTACKLVKFFEDVSEKSIERVNELYDRVGNPADTVKGAIEESVLDSVERISQPSVDMLKTISEQVTEVPNKLLRTAANVEVKKPATANKKAAKASASA